MKTLIYQYWVAKKRTPAIVAASCKNLKHYAKHIGADYRFDSDRDAFVKQMFGFDHPYAHYYDVVRPVYDKAFWKYDRIAFFDCDVFVRAFTRDNIFEEAPDCELAMAQEPDQPEMRAKKTTQINGKQDEVWARFVDKEFGARCVRRDAHGRPKVFNSGVVLWSLYGLHVAKDHFIRPSDYVMRMRRAGLPSFYACDQAYLRTMISIEDMIHFEELSCEWNRQVHHLPDGSIYDRRNADTRAVHVQLRGSDDWDEAKLYDIVNQPQHAWEL